MSRQERGVTLFAGSFESQLLNGFEHTTSASNIFDAIGALATSKANAPVKTVVLHEDVVLENPRVSIDAIRSIDPSAIIVYSGKHIHQHADASVDVKVTVEKQTIIKIQGIDKQLVGKIASEIKTLKPVEPYKGKGIKEKGQYVLRKEGKKK